VAGNTEYSYISLPTENGCSSSQIEIDYAKGPLSRYEPFGVKTHVMTFPITRRCSLQECRQRKLPDDSVALHCFKKFICQDLVIGLTMKSVEAKNQGCEYAGSGGTCLHFVSHLSRHNCRCLWQKSLHKNFLKLFRATKLSGFLFLGRLLLQLKRRVTEKLITCVWTLNGSLPDRGPLAKSSLTCEPYQPFSVGILI